MAHYTIGQEKDLFAVDYASLQAELDAAFGVQAVALAGADGYVETLVNKQDIDPARLDELVRAHGAPDVGTRRTLEAAKERACAAVDADAERRRLLVLTPGAGQAMEYDQ
ncbi:MAG: hypothetical protein HQK81_06060, partial [Desulfovibrionaceae bacterium]|nr:hypothetical protein [Desulfovibrionaceae bacterium]